MVRTRRLIIAALIALFLAGCSTPPTPADNNDPEIFRPKKPVYPMPQ